MRLQELHEARYHGQHPTVAEVIALIEKMSESPGVTYGSMSSRYGSAPSYEHIYFPCDQYQAVLSGLTRVLGEPDTAESSYWELEFSTGDKKPYAEIEVTLYHDKDSDRSAPECGVHMERY